MYIDHLAWELNIKSKPILAYLTQRGYPLSLSYTVDPDVAAEVRAHFRKISGLQEDMKTRSKSDRVPLQPLSGTPGIPVERFSFKLLPPGTWKIEDVIAHYRREAKRNSGGWRAQEFEEWRLVAIESLGPSKCYVGKEQWNGYVVFEFPGSPRVALECPRKGNATYVLWDDWKSMVVHSKGYIRDHFPHERVFHTDRGNWRREVRRALKLR